MDRRRAPELHSCPEPALALHKFEAAPVQDTRRRLSEEAVIIASLKVEGWLDEVGHASERLKLASSRARPH
jgi:hypothetical protein